MCNQSLRGTYPLSVGGSNAESPGNPATTLNLAARFPVFRTRHLGVEPLQSLAHASELPQVPVKHDPILPTTQPPHVRFAAQRITTRSSPQAGWVVERRFSPVSPPCTADRLAPSETLGCQSFVSRLACCQPQPEHTGRAALAASFAWNRSWRIDTKHDAKPSNRARW